MTIEGCLQSHDASMAAFKPSADKSDLLPLQGHLLARWCSSSLLQMPSALPFITALRGMHSTCRLPSFTADCKVVCAELASAADAVEACPDTSAAVVVCSSLLPATCIWPVEHNIYSYAAI